MRNNGFLSAAVLFISFLVVISLSSGCVSEGRKTGVFAREPDLVFSGTVADIRPAPLDQSLTSWAVTFRVEEVITGEYDEDYFSFLLHSPDRDFLKTGKRYRVEALKMRNGYLIDPNQWALREKQRLESGAEE